jgi:secretion/DNA translocation related CpaE-like protein
MEPSTLLVVATEPRTCEEAARWAAALGAGTRSAATVAQARRHWADAAAVVVDLAMAHELVAAGVARRPYVVMADPRVGLPGGLGSGDASEPWRVAVGLGAAHVCAPDATGQGDVLELLASALDGRGDACVVAVTGAVGGAGASTVAAGLALRAASRSWRTALVDLDPVGGADLVLGAETADGARWDTLDLTGGRLPAALVDVLPRHGEVAFLTASREAPAAALDPGPVVAATRRASDVVVLDVPRDPAASGVLARAELTVLVVPEDVRGIAAARRALAALQEVAGPVVVVARGVSAGLGRGAVSAHLEAPVAGRVAQTRGVRRGVAAGRGPAGSRTVRGVADAVLGLVGLTGSRTVR